MKKIAEIDRNMAVCTRIDDADLCWYDVRQEPFSIHGLYLPCEEGPFRRLPADVDMEDASALLEELCHDIRYGARPGSLGVKDELLATVACKAAIKAGRSSDPKEWKPVVDAVVSGEVRYCPHGRPVTMRLGKSQLEKNFKRT